MGRHLLPSALVQNKGQEGLGWWAAGGLGNMTLDLGFDTSTGFIEGELKVKSPCF